MEEKTREGWKQTREARMTDKGFVALLEIFILMPRGANCYFIEANKPG